MVDLAVKYDIVYELDTDDEIIIMGFELTNKLVKAKNILVDKENKFVKYL